jgi:1,5-anhydro-D-fructose reductase (1,5-anhydro-D-mannitol-forming)
LQNEFAVFNDRKTIRKKIKIEAMLRWLVVGLGDIAIKRVIPAILEEPRSRLAAIVTRDTAQTHPYGVPAFASLDEALSKAGFDAVYIATPVFLHAPQTLAALRAGFHVLCEKPMALNLGQAQSMVDAAAQHRRYLGVAYYRRAYPKVQRALELIRGGTIGEPVMAFATCHSELPSDPRRRSWLLDPAKAGGGPLYDIASHRIDLLNYFFGEPQEVRACLSNAVHQTAVEDSATVLIRYQNGVHGIVDARWNSAVVGDEFRIVGAKGELDLSPLNGPDLVLASGREALPSHSNLHYPCISNFVAGVLDGEQLLSSGATAVWTDWVTEKSVADSRGIASGRKSHAGAPIG